MVDRNASSSIDWYRAALVSHSVNPQDKHCSAIEAILFGGASNDCPAWLSSAVQSCQVRYAGLALTEEFEFAIKAFEDDSEPKPFELFVVGEGKFGKSTLVNCFLGEELSRVRVLPETRCFLRYVLKNSPSKLARLYVRKKAGVHDWLDRELGRGREVPSLYQVVEHETNLAHAKEILAEETERLDAGNYDAAILEVERDVKRSRRSAFRTEVRIVDTQGLDQLFPDEIKHKAIGLSEASSTALFMEWMNSSPRGKYLEWQFRRCDAVVWCVNAKRIGSAATSAALKYFSAYSKKIVLILTAVDLVAKNSNDLKKLMQRAWQLYGDHVEDICPLNGQAAWESIESGDDDLIASSGFVSLVDRIESTCISRGNKVRNLSRYFAVRKTERQSRNALRLLHERYRTTESRHRRELDNIIRVRNKTAVEMTSTIKNMFAKGREYVGSQSENIILTDNHDSARRKLGIGEVKNYIEDWIRGIVVDSIIPEIVLMGERVEPYSLPFFDADGRIAGSMIRVDFNRPAMDWDDPRVAFYFSLESMWGTHAFLAVREFFGSEKAAMERQQLECQRRTAVVDAFNGHWDDYQLEVVRAFNNEITRLFGLLLAELDEVYKSIERRVGKELGHAQKEIQAALADFAVKPAVSTGVIRALRRM